MINISIITATYNSALTIRDTLISVSTQTHPLVEHLIIDGISKDNTLEIVREFPHVACIISEKDDGLYDAMNKGISVTTGEVIGILNSDDFYAGNNILSLVAEAFTDASVDLCYGDLQYVHQDDTSRILRNWKAGEHRKSSFNFGWMPPHPALFVRKRVYDQIGGFNTSLKTAADYEFMLRAFVKHNFKARYIPQLFVKMRAGGVSNSSVSNRLKANHEDRIAWKINNLRPNFFLRFLKPLRKIRQFRP